MGFHLSLKHKRNTIMTRLTISIKPDPLGRISLNEFLLACRNNFVKFEKQKKKLSEKLEKIQMKYGKQIYDELILEGVPEGNIFEPLTEKLSSIEFIQSNSDLLTAFKNLQHIYLQKSRSNIRIYKKVPHLYTDAELVEPFWSLVYKKIHFNNMFPRFSHTFCTERYVNIVKKNMIDFKRHYEDVVISYRHSIMQTQFKLQLVLGHDVSREILSYLCA